MFRVCPAERTICVEFCWSFHEKYLCFRNPNTIFICEFLYLRLCCGHREPLHWEWGGR
jgi:hypothetical protein